MRITQKTLFGNFMRDINKNRAEMGRLQSDLSSGKAVRVPSQDPVSFQRSRIIEENIRKEGQYQNNLSSGLRQARLTSESLDNTIDRLIDVKQIMVQGANDSSNEKLRANMADEIAGIRDNMVDNLNLSYGDRYLFAGTNSGNAPFAVNGAGPGGVENNSNGTPPQIQAGDGVRIDVSISGAELRATDNGDLFEILGNVEEALRNNDQEAVNQLIGDLEGTIEHAATLNSRLGSNINRMEYMFEQYESSSITQKSDVSSMVDTDYAQAFSDLQRTQVAFESAMAVHSTMFGNTLLDYL
ncbi:MAG: flagellar hook-associated protein FlgL [Balneolaceae bacterium]|nr:flagellar hook-associated protein FlgL [Balneolaceae bacterium]MCH8547296.1 flagellar hook-associated protein FlgL [Balneolaceae bacterium]